MKVSVLASGSKGNSTYIETEKAKILIDIGMSCAYIEKNLKSLNIEPKEINYIFITHAHTDHINGLRVFLKKNNTKVYLTKTIKSEIPIEISNYEYIDDEKEIDDFQITPIKTSHDTKDSQGYIIESNNKSIVYITDTGYIHKKNHKKLENKTMYIIESNHDVEKLMNGKYPHHLKQRILSDKGHLSNKDSSYYLSKFITNNTKYIYLAHLSEENNTEELALAQAKKTLKKANINIIDIKVLKQKERTELVKL